MEHFDDVCEGVKTCVFPVVSLQLISTNSM